MADVVNADVQDKKVDEMSQSLQEKLGVVLAALNRTTELPS